VNWAALRRQVVGPLSAFECEVLAEKAAASSASRALEVGHYLGLSTCVLLSSLPAGCELVTIDHHQGDAWAPSSDLADFEGNIAPFVGDRTVTVVNDDMVAALPTVGDGFGFVFYDADHTASAVTSFWEAAVSLLSEQCTLVFDDADWAEQATLRGLAESAGFEVTTVYEFHRGPSDKHDAGTYTLEIMDRFNGS